MVDPIPLHPRAPDAPSTAKKPRSNKAGGNKLGKLITGAFPRRALSQPTAPEGARARPRLTAHERAFLPAALEIIETPASPTLRWTALGLCALIVTAIAWAWLARIDMVAVAQGKVVPLGQVKVVQPLETAMIRAIHVDEGDHVMAGQLLVDLDPTEAQADLGALAYNRTQAALDAEVARVLLTRDPAEPFHPPAGADPVLAAHNKLQADREIDRHRAAITGLEADIAQKQAGLETNAAQIERLTLTLPLLEERLATVGGLFDKRYGARQPVLDVQHQLVEKRGDLKAAQSTVHQIEAETRSLRAKAVKSRAIVPPEGQFSRSIPTPFRCVPVSLPFEL